MIHIEPLFWLLALCLSVPWGIVTWLGFDVARLKRKRRFWKDRYHNLMRQIDRERYLFETTKDGVVKGAAALEPKIVDDLGNVVRFAGKHQRPRVVEVPFKGKVK